MRIAIPTNNPGGMEATRSEHFGHCDVFTLVEVDAENNISSVETLPVPEHGTGGCTVTRAYICIGRYGYPFYNKGTAYWYIQS